jgi:hypothetical protein
MGRKNSSSRTGKKNMILDLEGKAMLILRPLWIDTFTLRAASSLIESEHPVVHFTSRRS